MFFKGSARPPPPQAAPQQHPEKIKAPPAPIEPPSSMLDMDPSPPAPAYEAKPEFVPPSQIANGPAAGYFSSFPATTPQLTTIDSQGSTSRLRPPSQPPTPTADRAFAHSPVLGNSPRMMAPSSPLASSSPRVSISSISPGTATGVAVPTIPTLTLTAPQLPLMKPPTPVVSQPLTPVAGVFSGGSAPSTPAASGMVANSIAPSQGLPAQSLAAATPPTQYVTRKTGGNEAANIFGAPPTPAATDAAAIFSTGSAPSTPAASGLMANSIPASQGMPAPILATSTPSAHQPFMKTGNEAANIFESTPPAVQDPQIPVANHAANLFGGATAVSDAANQPVQANHPTASMIQTPQAQPTTSAPLETIEKTTLPPMQRSTPPSSPRRYEPPASPATPLMRNQNLTNKAQTPELSRPSPKSTVSSNLPTPIRRNLRPPPKAQTSPRTTPSRAKFRLPPPRKKATPLKFGAGKEDKAKITTPRDEIPSAPTSPRRDLPSTPKSEQLTPGIIDPQLSEDKSGPPSLPTMAHAEQQAPVETKTEPSMAETPRTTVPEETTAHEFAPEETPKVVEASGLGMDEPSLDSLPDGWMEIVDPASGRFYYLNETTKETSWEKPQCEQANQETPALAPETETEGEDSAKPNEEQNDTRIPEEGTIDETDKATPPTSENEEEVKAESPEILPEGWVVAIDPSSGQSYYYNSISQETRWERPIVEESESAGEQWEWPKDDEPSPEAEISHKEAIDSTFAEMNAEFGIDEMRETGETSKEENQSAEIEDETATMEALRLAPGESDDPTRSETEPTKFPSNLPDGWSEIVDPSSGRTYYYNSITQDTSWEYPFRQREESITHTELENQSEDAMVDTTIQEIASNLTPETAEPELFHQSEAAQSLPKGWTEVLDPQSGSTYYYNAVTQETSWERPAETEKTETGERIGAQAASAKSEKMASGNMPETEKHFPETPECTGKPKEFHEATSFEAQPENVAAGAEQFVEDEPRAPEFCESTLVDDLPDSDQPETEIVEEEAAEARDANVYDRLQDDWVEVVDPASGQTYYCNTITQETSWERPLQEGQLSAEQPEGDTTTAEQTNVEEKLSSIDAHGDSFKDDAPDGDQPETEVAESEAVDRPSFDDQSLPDGWVEAEDPASGQIYYYNTVTQETSWEKPVKVASPAKAQAFDSASGQLDERDQVQSLQTEDDIAADVPEADKSKPETAAEEQAESDIIDQGLPDGWIEAEDPASGKIYYYNTVTQETSWEKPMQVASPAKDQAEGFDSAPEQLDEEDEPRSLEAEDDIVADVSETDDKGLPDDWVEADDGASGQIYYYNTVTQETAWEKPILVGQPEDEQPESGALPEQPDEEDEPRSLETEDTVAEDVPEADESEPEAVGEEPVESDIVNKGLPDGWVEVEDPASGQIYYYNTVTQETSWEMPILEGQPEDQQQESEGASTEQPDEEDEPQSLETEDDIVADVPETEEPEPETAGEEPSDGEFIDQGLPDDWVEAEDPASGKIYYYNTVTQETSWEKPTPEQPGERDQPQSLESEDDIPADVPEADEPEPEAVGEDPVESDIVNKGLPDGWVEVEDPASGQIYYYNKVTQETSWEKPVVEGQPEEEQQVSEGAPTKQPDEEDDPQSLETEDDIPADVPETDEPKPEKAGEEPPGGEIIDQGMPDDWVKAEDPACGKTSNYNTVPEETTWQKHMKVVLPAKDQAENDDAARQQPGGAEAPSLEVVSDAPPESTHLEPRESEKIEDVDTGDSNVGEEGLPDDWVETKDPAGGQIYYYNTATQETSWERPSHPVQAEDYDSAIESKEALPSQQEELEQDEIDQPSALGEWSEEIDPQSGQVYYYNRSTMETRWDSPKTLEKEEPSAEVNVEESGREEEEADEDKSSEVEGDSSDMPVDWTEAVDPASGNIFYYNTVTGETSWENPFGQAANPKNESTEGKDDTDAIDVSREGSLDQFEDEFEVTEDDTKSSDGEGAKDEFEDEVKGKETNLPKATKLSDLPEFWTDAVDPSTGKIYYFNSLTQETSWDRPTIESKTDQSESIDDVSVDQKDPGQVEPVKSEETPEEDSKESEESNIAEGGSLEKTDSYVLPANWTEVEAPQNGQKYYYNEVTQETLLDRPSQDETVVTHSPRGEERILIEDQRDNQTPEIVAPTNEDLNPDAKGTPDKGPDEIYVSPEADALPEGWVELVDPGSGATYYFNEIDSSTTWERPTASSAIESTNTPEKEGGGVVEPEEDRPQSEFSEKEEVPVPETADCSGKTGDLGKHGQRPVAEDSGHTLPDGWIELVDPSSGTPYYFNETTEETSWDRPAARKGEMSIPATSETEGAGFTGMQEIVTPEEKYLEQVNVEKESDKVEGEAVESPEGDQNELPLQNGWVELVDPSSGQPYYFNEAENQTLWERPVVQVVSKSSLVPALQGKVLEAEDATAAFEFVGMLSSFLPKEGESEQLVITRTAMIATKKRIAKIEDDRRCINISGPLNLGEESAVLAYIESKVINTPDDLLWKLIEIAAKSKGRLRSDEGVSEKSSPESAIVKILLQDDPPRANANPKRDSGLVQQTEGE